MVGIAGLSGGGVGFDPTNAGAGEAGFDLPPFPGLILAEQFGCGAFRQVAHQIIFRPRPAPYLHARFGDGRGRSFSPNGCLNGSGGGGGLGRKFSLR